MMRSVFPSTWAQAIQTTASSNPKSLYYFLTSAKDFFAMTLKNILNQYKTFNFYSMKKNQSASTLPNASWAHKYGISKENNGSGVFGLNPNLNIEDQYIENLLKQIHFMTMEIKLLKEKQQQSDGNALWGIVNRVNEPLVKNIVDSNQKYHLMKKQVDLDLNKTEYENMRLADQQSATLKRMAYLEDKIETLEQDKKERQKAAKDRQVRILEKISQHQAKMKTISAEKEAQNKKLKEYTEQYDGLVNDVEKEDFQNGYEVARIKNNEEIEEIILNDRIKEIEDIKHKIGQLKATIESNLEFQRAQEDQLHIKENMDKVCKNIAAAEFELLQVNESIKLAEREKEKEVLERKRLMEEYESLKKILKEIKSLNQTRIEQETVNRMRESVDIQKGEYQTKKLEKNLEEIKKKITRSEQSEKALKQEVQHMERELSKLKSKRDTINKTLTELINDNDRQDTQLSSYKNQYRKIQEQYDKLGNSELTSSCELNQIETEITYLRQRKDYLSEALNLKQALNQTKLQELQRLVQKNKDVNETVGTLMGKWEEIRQFSKM